MHHPEHKLTCVNHKIGQFHQGNFSVTQEIHMVSSSGHPSVPKILGPCAQILRINLLVYHPVADQPNHHDQEP